MPIERGNRKAKGRTRVSETRDLTQARVNEVWRLWGLGQKTHLEIAAAVGVELEDMRYALSLDPRTRWVRKCSQCRDEVTGLVFPKDAIDDTRVRWGALRRCSACAYRMYMCGRRA